jgi:hypothetical protein
MHWYFPGNLFQSPTVRYVLKLFSLLTITINKSLNQQELRSFAPGFPCHRQTGVSESGDLKPPSGGAAEKRRSWVPLDFITGGKFPDSFCFSWE